MEKNVQTERTPDGNIIYSFSTDPVATTSPLKGKSLTLTIDMAIQHICEQELYKMIYKRSAFRGTVIVMNPKNGEILAYAVYLITTRITTKMLLKCKLRIGPNQTFCRRVRLLKQ